MTTYLSTLSVIWEECVDREICVRIPIIGKKCVRIQACVRLLKEGDKIVAEVEAFGRRWRYALTSACHTVFEWAIAKLRLCIKKTSGGVQLVLEGCLDVAGIKKCWTLLAYDIQLFAMNDMSQEAMAFFGGTEVGPTAFDSHFAGETGVLATPLTEAEALEVMSQKDA